MKLSNLDLNATDRVKTVKKSESKERDLNAVVNPIFEKKVDLHSMKAAILNTTHNESLPYLASEVSDLHSASGTSGSNNNTISKGDKQSISSNLPLINESNQSNVTIGRRRILLKRQQNSLVSIQ